MNKIHTDNLVLTCNNRLCMTIRNYWMRLRYHLKIMQIEKAFGLGG